MEELNEILQSFNKSPLRFLKRNFNLIIILPTVLGGLWQIIELSQMSFSFIRFFSVSQIIPDGLLILMFLIVFIISASLLIHYWKKLGNDEDDNENETISTKGNILYSIFFFSCFWDLFP